MLCNVPDICTPVARDHVVPAAGRATVAAAHALAERTVAATHRATPVPVDTDQKNNKHLWSKA